MEGGRTFHYEKLMARIQPPQSILVLLKMGRANFTLITTNSSVFYGHNIQASV